MGIVWEASHKGVPLLGVPENPIDYRHVDFNFSTLRVVIKYQIIWIKLHPVE